MDFFEAQDRARARTRLAIFLFALSVAAIVVTLDGAYLWAVSATRQEPLPLAELIRQEAEPLTWISLGLVAIIAIGSLSRILLLRQGGGFVARTVGGTLVDPGTKDYRERRLLNIVQEISLASGVPVPEVYVLQKESGINAFAAGFEPADAAVAVTRGALEQLNRDELQGVIAHEFSHILNGDMRLNIRLIGVLHGILLIALIGQRTLRMMAYAQPRTRRSGGRGGGGIPVLMAGALVMMLVGYIGLFFARVIKAAVSRQREYLADAAAVQFTRNPAGISGALKKIAGLESGSKIRDGSAEELSHMFFSLHRRIWFNLLSTHPPVEKRIAAIDPTFRPDQEAQVAARWSAAWERADGAMLGFGGATAAVEQLDPDVLTGNPQLAALQAAQRLIDDLPDDIRNALAAPEPAELLVLSLFVDPQREGRAPQVEALRARYAEEQIHDVAGLFRSARKMPAGTSLQLIELAAPQLRRLTVDRQQELLEAAEALVRADGVIEPRELGLLLALRAVLQDALDPVMRLGARALSQEKDAAHTVLSWLALVGADGDDDAEAAYIAGWQELFGTTVAPPRRRETVDGQAVLDAVDRLDGVDFRGKKLLCRGLLAAAASDGRIRVEEYEIVRGVHAALHVPLPPALLEPETTSNGASG